MNDARQTLGAGDEWRLVVKLTEFGKEIRRLRLEHEERLKDMADRLSLTPAFLSSIETGRKPVPAAFVDRVVQEYEIDDAARLRLQRLADATRTIFEIKLQPTSSAQHRETAAVLARKFPSLNDADLADLAKFLNGRRR
jgi:transcriptional regulator with XRE-family HTH domain